MMATDTAPTEAERAAYRDKLRSLQIGSRKALSRDGGNWFDTTIRQEQEARIAEAAANGHDVRPVSKRAVLR